MANLIQIKNPKCCLEMGRFECTVKGVPRLPICLLVLKRGQQTKVCCTLLPDIHSKSALKAFLFQPVACGCPRRELFAVNRIIELSHFFGRDRFV